MERVAVANMEAFLADSRFSWLRDERPQTKKRVLWVNMMTGSWKDIRPKKKGKRPEQGVTGLSFSENSPRIVGSSYIVGSDEKQKSKRRQEHRTNTAL